MSWTNVAKPSSSNYTNVAKPVAALTFNLGYATGILGPPTYSDQLVITNWVNVSKPLTSAWTKINKPT